MSVVPGVTSAVVRASSYSMSKLQRDFPHTAEPVAAYQEHALVFRLPLRAKASRLGVPVRPPEVAAGLHAFARLAHRLLVFARHIRSLVCWERPVHGAGLCVGLLARHELQAEEKKAAGESLTTFLQHLPCSIAHLQRLEGQDRSTLCAESSSRTAP